MCIPDAVSNQTKHIEWHETCKCKCRLDASVCNTKQRWNEDKCRCKCREELIDKERCDKGLVWSPSNRNCECNKSCDIGEYLDYENCKCRRKMNSVECSELVEECRFDENEMIYSETLDAISLNVYKRVCGSCTLCIVLFAVFLVTSTVISTVFICFYWYSKMNITNVYY